MTAEQKTEERLDEDYDQTELDRRADDDTGEPQVPSEITDSAANDLKTEAARIVSVLKGAEGGKGIDVAEELATIGVKEETATVREMELLKVRLGAVMSEEGAGSDIGRDMVELRRSLDELNPQGAPGGSVVGRALKSVPIVGRLFSPVNALKKIAIRYEPVSAQVAAIETRLREGKRTLLADNAELRKLYEGVEQKRPSVIRGAYFGELLVYELEKAIEAEQDAEQVERFRTSLHDVATRVQDLKTINEVIMQYLVSIEMNRQNNLRLSQAVDRTLALGGNVVLVGLAIQVALSRQRRVMEANKRTREFLGGMIAANAAAIKQHTAEIGDVYNNPVIAIEVVERAHADLVDAIDSVRMLREDGVRQAKDNMSKLDALLSRNAPQIAAALPQATGTSGGGAR